MSTTPSSNPSSNPARVVRVVGHGIQDVRVRADGSAWLTDDDGRDALQIAPHGTVDSFTPEATLQWLADEAGEDALRREQQLAARTRQAANDRAAEQQLAGTDHVRRAGDALAALSADVENGGTRLTNYPSILPALEDLVAAVQDITTAPTLTHDQLAAFGRLAHEASVGALVDGYGACASLAIEPAPQAGWAHVLANGKFCASVSPDGSVHYETAEGRQS